MTAERKDRVFRFLPPMYRRAGPETVLGGLTGVLEHVLDLYEGDAHQVLMAACLDQAPDLADATALAALYHMAPFPEERLADFRLRVRTMARIYLSGPASASALLEVAGLALNATTAAGPALPGEKLDGADSANDLYTTSVRLKRRDGERTYTLAVEDAPRTPRRVPVALTPDGRFTLENNLWKELPRPDGKGGVTPGEYPDPVIDLQAGDRPLILPVLVQRNLKRWVLINRIIPPGAALRVDLSARPPAVVQLGGPACLEGPVLHNGARPKLLFGEGGQVGGRVTLPLLLWKTEAPAVSYLGTGQSDWQLLQGRNLRGMVPEADERLSPSQVRPLVATPAPGMAITCYWQGRQPGSFTLRLGPELSGETPQDLPPRQKAWLAEQLGRLKQAGVAYLPEAELEQASLKPPAPDEASPPAIWVWDRVRPYDDLSTDRAPRHRLQALTDQVVASDRVTITVR